MKKRSLLALILVSVLALGACAQKETTQVAKETEQKEVKEVVVQVGSSPESIDPAINHAVDSGNMLVHAFEGLLKVNRENEVVEGLAKAYEISEDGKVYTFTLRDDIKWSDGTAITAKDFEYSFKRVVDPNTAAPYAFDVLGLVEGFEEANSGENLDALKVYAKDDKTFVVELKNPVPYFKQIVAFNTLVPVKQEVVEQYGEAWATNPETFITSGPYKMVEFSDKDRIVFEKNEHYYDADKITFDRIVWRLIEDQNAAKTAYDLGEISLIKSVPSEEVPSLRGSDEFHIAPLMGTYYVAFNTEKAPFNNAKFRKALSLVIDREYVANTIMQGTYIPANTIVGPGISDAKGDVEFRSLTPNYTKGVNSANYEDDVKMAQELMKEAGYPNGEGLDTIEYSLNDAGYHKPVAEYLKSVWEEKLGLKIELSVKEWKVFQADRNQGNFDIARHGWILDWNDPANILNLFISHSGNNDGKVNVPAYDELMDKASKTLDQEERFKYLHEAEKVMLDEAGMAPIAHYADFYLQKPNLKNIWHSPYGYWFFMYGTLE